MGNFYLGILVMAVQEIISGISQVAFFLYLLPLFFRKIIFSIPWEKKAYKRILGIFSFLAILNFLLSIYVYFLNPEINFTRLTRNNIYYFVSYKTGIIFISFFMLLYFLIILKRKYNKKMSNRLLFELVFIIDYLLFAIIFCIGIAFLLSIKSIFYIVTDDITNFLS